MPKKTLQGAIVSDKMDQTVVVKTVRIKIDPKYKKRYRVFKKYKACGGKEEYQAGDKVIIEECRPLSKDKKWRIVKKI